MDKITLQTDIRIAKQRRAHVLLDADEQIIGWYPTIIEALNKAADMGKMSLTIRDDEGAYVVTFLAVEAQDEK